MNSTYCNFGFTSVHWDSNGRTAPCCTFRGPDDPRNLSASEYWNSDWLTKLQNKMLAGEEVAGCNRCYEEERMSGSSMRDTTPADTVNPIIQRMHITYSNLCNKTCNICRPYRSHLIGKEYQKIIKNDPDNVWMKDKIVQQPYTEKTLGTIKFEGLGDEQIQDISNHINDIKQLYVDGGEVFIDKQYFVKILEIIKAHNRHKHIQLKITTNASFTEDDLELLKDFRKVKFLISADGINNLYELVRSPHNWEWFTNKLKLLEKYPHFESQGETVMHCFNVHQLPEIVEYWNNNVSLTMLFHQEYLGAHICPDYVLEESATKLEALGRTNNARYLRSCITKNIQKDKVLFHEFIKTMEPVKKLNYQSYIPWSFDLVK